MSAVPWTWVSRIIGISIRTHGPGSPKSSPTYRLPSCDTLNSLPQVKVHLTQVDKRIYITISDNGPGIPASVRTTLFDPFVAAGKPTEQVWGSRWHAG